MRSGRLVAWTRAWRAGLVTYDSVLDAVPGPGERHRLVEADGSDAPLGRLLVDLRTDEPRLVLPVPGDPRGLPGPGAFTDGALLAGEAVLAGSLGVVPAVSGPQVTWRCYEVPLVEPEPLTLAESEHDLADAIRNTALALTEMGVARWRPRLAAALADLRRPGPSGALPPGYPARAHRLLAQADRIDTIVSIAGDDSPGAALGAGTAVARERLLRSVGTAARRARTAAYNAGVQPDPLG